MECFGNIKIIKLFVFVSYVGQLFDSLLIRCLSLWLLAGEQRKHISGEHCAATNECDPSVCVCSGLLFAINCGHKKETKKNLNSKFHRSRRCSSRQLKSSCSIIQRRGKCMKIWQTSSRYSKPLNIWRRLTCVMLSHQRSKQIFPNPPI